MKTGIFINVLLFSCVVTSLVASSLVLDPTLTPRFICFSLCLCFCCFYLFEEKWEGTLKADLILLAYSAYAFFCCLSVLWAKTKSEAIFEASKTVLGFFSFLLFYAAFRKERDYFLNALSRISVILFLIVFVAAILQFSQLSDLSKESLYRVNTLHGHKNLFSSYLFLNLFFLLLGSIRLANPWKLISRICLVLNLALLVMLKTKAVWLGLGVALSTSVLLYLFYRIKKGSTPKLSLPVQLGAFLVVLNIFFFFLLQPVIQRGIHYTSQVPGAPEGQESSNMKLEEERLILWDKTYHQIRQKPVVGVGMGNWQVYLPDASLTGLWRGEDLNFTFQRPHNDLLWILSETGAVGFNLFFLFIGGILLLLIRALRSLPEDPVLRLEIIACFAWISGYLTISFFDFPKERIEHILWIHLVLALAYYHIHSYAPVKTYGDIRINRSKLLAASVLVSFVAITGMMRFRGEFFTKGLYNFKNAANFSKVVEAGASAQNYAYSIDPTSVPLPWYTGNAHASMGQYTEARKDFIKAYQLNPYNRNVLNDLGSSCVFNNDVLQAKVYYEEAARISPRFDEPKLNLAAMYMNAGDFNTANLWLKSIFHNSERRSNYQKMVDLSLKASQK